MIKMAKEITIICTKGEKPGMEVSISPPTTKVMGIRNAKVL